MQPLLRNSCSVENHVGMMVTIVTASIILRGANGRAASLGTRKLTMNMEYP